MAHKYKYTQTPFKTLHDKGTSPHLTAYDSVYVLGLNSEGDTLYAVRWGKVWGLYRVFDWDKYLTHTPKAKKGDNHSGQTGATFKTLNDIESAWHLNQID